MKIKQEIFEDTYHHIDVPTKRIKNKCLLPDNDIETYKEEHFFYLRNHNWIGSLKCDGTNLRIYYDGENLFFNGKTNNANFTPDQIKYLEKTFLEENFENIFRKEGISPKVILFLELCGPKIQGGDQGRFKELEAILYDVKIGDFFLDEKAIKDIAKNLNIKSTYDYLEVKGTLFELVEFVKNCEGAIEGIVAEPEGRFYSRNKKRIITKIKCRDY